MFQSLLKTHSNFIHGKFIELPNLMDKSTLIANPLIKLIECTLGNIEPLLTFFDGNRWRGLV